MATNTKKPAPKPAAKPIIETAAATPRPADDKPVACIVLATLRGEYGAYNPGEHALLDRSLAEALAKADAVRIKE